MALCKPKPGREKIGQPLRSCYHVENQRDTHLIPWRRSLRCWHQRQKIGVTIEKVALLNMMNGRVIVLIFSLILSLVTQKKWWNYYKALMWKERVISERNSPRRP